MRVDCLPRLAVLGLLFASISLTGPIRADDGEWSTEFGPAGFDFEVLDVAASGDTLVAVGSFVQYDVTPLYGVGLWNGSSWNALGGAFLDENGEAFYTWMNTVAFYEGQIVVGGDFAFVDSVAVQNVARWTGSSWEPMGLGLADEVKDLRVEAGVLYAATEGGVFTFDEADWNLFGAPITGLRSMALYNGLPVVVGWLDVAGQSAKVAGWNGSAWDIWATTSDWTPGTLEVHNGQLYLGGQQRQIDSVAVRSIGVWDGTAWAEVPSPFVGSTDNNIWDLHSHGGYLYATGWLEPPGIGPGKNVFRWDGTAWELVGGGITEYEAFCYALGTYQGDLVLAGHFHRIGGAVAWGLARWDEAQWSRIGEPTLQGLGFASWFGLISFAEDLEVVGGDLYVGGFFSTAGSAPAYGVARYDGIEMHSTDFPFEGWVQAVGQHEGHAVVGGNLFGAPSSIYQRTGAGWLPLGGQFDDDISAITSFGGEIVVGGRFTHIGADSIPFLAAWDGSDWYSFAGGVDGPVSAFLHHQGGLVIGGSFALAAGNPVHRIGRWDGLNWHSYGGGVGGVVRSLGTYNGELVAGGTFMTAGSVSAENIALWDGTAWNGFGVDFPDPFWTGSTEIHGLAQIGNRLYVGGRFATTNGIGTNGIVAYDGVSWTGLGDGVDYSRQYGNVVESVAVYKGRLLIAGDFYSVSGVPAYGIAAWTPASVSVPEGTTTPALLAVSPNPFAERVELRFAVDQRSRIQIDVFDINGRHVARLADSMRGPGVHTVNWDGRDSKGRASAPGVYFARVSQEGRRSSHKLIKIR